MGVAQHVDLGRQTAPTASERVVLRFFRPLFFRRLMRLGLPGRQWNQSSMCPGRSNLARSSEYEDA